MAIKIEVRDSDADGMRMDRLTAEAIRAYRRQTGPRRTVDVSSWKLFSSTRDGSSLVYEGMIVGPYDRKTAGSPVLDTVWAYVTEAEPMLT